MLSVNTPWLAQPSRGVRLSANHPLAQRLAVAYMPGVSGDNLARGRRGRFPHTGDGVGNLSTLGRAYQKRSAGTAQGELSFRSSAYPWTLIWVGVLNDNTNTINIAAAYSSAAPAATYWYVGGGSSSLVNFTARNNYGATASLYATPPDSVTLGVPLCIIAQSLSASDHRLCVGGMAVTTDTTNIGAPAATFDYVGIGKDTNNHDTAFVAFGHGIAWSDHEMIAFSSNPRNYLQLLEPRRIWVPAAAAVGYTHPTLSNARMGSLTSTGGVPLVDYAF